MTWAFVPGSARMSRLSRRRRVGMGYAPSAQSRRYGGAGLREAEYAHVQDFAFSNLTTLTRPSLVTRMTTDVTGDTERSS